MPDPRSVFKSGALSSVLAPGGVIHFNTIALMPPGLLNRSGPAGRHHLRRLPACHGPRHCRVAGSHADGFSKSPPCVSTSFVAKTLPLPCVPTASTSVSNTLPSPCVSTASAPKTPPLPCVSTAPVAKTRPLPCPQVRLGMPTFDFNFRPIVPGGLS